MFKHINNSISRVVAIALATVVVNFSMAVNAEENSGKQVFEQECASCHTGGFKGWVSGAPEIGSKEDWLNFINKGPKKMTKVTIEGGEGMDPMGGCKTCSEAQIKAAVDYIILKTK
jgi:cytochrome c5